MKTHINLSCNNKYIENITKNVCSFMVHQRDTDRHFTKIVSGHRPTAESIIK